MAIWVVHNDLNCRDCTEILQEARGCNGFKGYEETEIDGIKVDKCPLKLIDADAWEYLEAYYMFKKGFLPVESGNWLDVGYKFLKIMRFIDNKFNEYQIQEIENAKKERR